MIHSSSVSSRTDNSKVDDTMLPLDMANLRIHCCDDFIRMMSYIPKARTASETMPFGALLVRVSYGSENGVSYSGHIAYVIDTPPWLQKFSVREVSTRQTPSPMHGYYG
ncbi:uncharacterized protein LOC121825325 [Peromyscus maniculatus bairdii]|uniref:uncharacterized protein LOC121825325 n=1 Tax=Peromyscus maniculatus bairdii TaxID=230844 RepID=UPI003FCFC156